MEAAEENISAIYSTIYPTGRRMEVDNKRLLRQADKFRGELLRRIEAGGQAREMLTYARAEINRLEEERNNLVVALAGCHHQGAQAREALRQVEWAEPDDDAYCPWCGNYKSFRHAPDCPRQLALGISNVTE